MPTLTHIPLTNHTPSVSYQGRRSVIDSTPPVVE